jgi:hypothetical protein
MCMKKKVRVTKWTTIEKAIYPKRAIPLTQVLPYVVVASLPLTILA